MGRHFKGGDKPKICLSEQKAQAYKTLPITMYSNTEYNRVKKLKKQGREMPCHLKSDKASSR